MQAAMHHPMPHRGQAGFSLLQPLQEFIQRRRVIREMRMLLGENLTLAVLDLKMAGGQPDPLDARRQLQRLVFAREEQRDLQARRTAVDRQDALVVCVYHLTDIPSIKAGSIARSSAVYSQSTNWRSHRCRPLLL